VSKPTGYKATRKTIAEKRQDHRDKVWREADVPGTWESRGADKNLMRDLLTRTTPGEQPDVQKWPT